LDLQSQFELVVFALKSLAKILKSGSEIAHGLKEGGSSSLMVIRTSYMMPI